MADLRSPVLFNQVLNLIPEEAIVIEIAPHCLLQAILKKSIPRSCTSLGLMKANEHDLEFFLKSIGRLYNEGINIKSLDEFLSCPTINIENTFSIPSLSPAIFWDHSKSWRIPFANPLATNASEKFGDFGDFSLMTRKIKSKVHTIDLRSEEWRSIAGHNIDGRILFPATGYIRLIIDTMLEYGDCFDFHDVTFLSAVMIPEDGCQLMVNILSGNGDFEISQLPSKTPVCNGRVTLAEKSHTQLHDTMIDAKKKFHNILSSDEVYRILRLRGYEYAGSFKSISWMSLDKNADASCAIQFPKQSQADVHVSWIAFLDCMLQFYLLARDMDDSTLSIPIRLTKLHVENFEVSWGTDYIVSYNKYTKSVHCGPIFFNDVSVATVNRRKPTADCVLGCMKLVELQTDDLSRLPAVLNVVLDVCARKNRGSKLKACRLLLNKVQNENTFDGTNDIDFLTSGKPYLDYDIDWYCASLQQDTLINEADIIIIGDEHSYATLANSLEFFDKNGHVNQSRLPLDKRSQPIVLPETTRLIKRRASNILTRSCSAFCLNANGVEPNETSELKTNMSIDNVRQIVHKLSQHSSDSFVIVLPMKNDIANELSLQCDQWIRLLLAEHSHQSTLILKHTLHSLRHQVVRVHKDFKKATWIEDIKNQISKQYIDRVWLISNNDDQCGLIGLLNCISKEPNGHKCRCLLTSSSTLDSINITKILAFLKMVDLPINILQSDHTQRIEKWMTTTHNLSDTTSILTRSGNGFTSFELCIEQLGDLSSLFWKRTIIQSKDVSSVSVIFASLNFRDVMLASSRLSVNSIPGYEKFRDRLPLGMEFSGLMNGHRVMGLVSGGAFSTEINNIDERFLFPIPNNWSFEEAATVPVVYATAYYSLCVRGQLKKGERVLIHAGAGGVGMASIRVARSFDCEIFTTVSSSDKREFIMKTFNIADTHILNSRSTDFYFDILKLTQGEGVHIVLNSLAGDMLQHSVKCLAENGRFLEIGKYDLQNNSSLKMAIFLKNVSFHGILLDSLFGNPVHSDWNKVHALLSSGIEMGVVEPLKFTVFPASNVESAFRFMAQGKHSGKILVQLKNESNNILSMPVNVRSTLRFPSKRWFLITGGLGGLGLQVVHFLISRGVTHVVLTSRNGKQNAFQEYMLQKVLCGHENVKILILKNELQNEENLLEMYEAMRLSNSVIDNNLAGVFHLAGVLDDGMFEGSDCRKFQNVFRPKYETLKLLDRELRGSVDYFVAFSSIAAGFGNAGQTNYGMANSVVDSICMDRTERGMYGLSIQLGPVDDVGMFARIAQSHSLILSSLPCVKSAIIPLKLKQVLDSLETIMINYEYQRENLFNTSPYRTDSVNSLYARQNIQHSTFHTSSIKGSKTKSIEDVLNNILGIQNLSKIDPNSKLSDLGLDSLGAVEMSQVMESYFNAKISSKDLQDMKLADLMRLTKSQQSVISEQQAQQQQQEQETKNTRDESSSKNVPQILTLALKPISLMKWTGNDSNIIILVHAIEGNSDCFEHLVSKIQEFGNIYVIRPTKNTPTETFETLANYLIEEIHTILPPRASNNLTLIGYSFGCTLALYIAEKLNSSRLRHIVMLDGSPYQLSQMSKKYINTNVRDSLIESEAFHYFLSLALKNTDQCSKSNIIMDKNEIMKKLVSLKDTDERRQAVIMMCKNAGLDAPDAGLAASRFLARLYMSAGVDLNKKFNIDCMLTLVKTNETVEQFSSDYASDYGLEAMLPNLKCKSYHTLICDHVSLLNEENSNRIAEIIRDSDAE